jgi:Uma2 family endonuclease
MTKLPMSIEEYLRASFEGDREYLDGKAVERTMGEMPHATVLGEMIYQLGRLESQLDIEVLSIIRMQLRPTRIRVADVGVWRRSASLEEEISTTPPFLVVEVLDSGDRWTPMHAKIQEYLEFGVEWIWLIDPDDRQAFVFTPTSRAGTLVPDVLRTHSPAIAIPLTDVFAELPPPSDSAAKF